MNFNQMRKAVKEEEQEMKTGVYLKPIQSRGTDETDASRSEMLLKKLTDLENQMKELNNKQKEMAQKQRETEQRQKQRL